MRAWLVDDGFRLARRAGTRHRPCLPEPDWLKQASVTSPTIINRGNVSSGYQTIKSEKRSQLSRVLGPALPAAGKEKGMLMKRIGADCRGSLEATPEIHFDPPDPRFLSLSNSGQHSRRAGTSAGGGGCAHRAENWRRSVLWWA